MATRERDAPLRGAGVVRWVGLALGVGVGGLLLFGYTSELYLKKKLQRRAGEVGLKVSWDHASWGLGEACLDQLRWQHAHVELHGSAQSLCVHARWRWAWPPLLPEHVTVKRPKVVAPLEWLREQREVQARTPRSSAATLKSADSRLSQLLKALPVDLDVDQGSLWLTERGESVASFALELGWRPLQRPTAPLAQVTGQARLRGISAPFDFQGTLDRRSLQVSAPRGPWTLPAGPHTLQLQGLSVSLSGHSLRLHELGAHLEGYGDVTLEATVDTAQRVAQLGPGAIRVTEMSAARELKRELEVIVERLQRAVAPLGLVRSQPSEALAPARSNSEREALPLMGLWRLLASELTIEGVRLSSQPASMVLDELMLSAGGARVSLRQTGETRALTPSANMCLAEGCLGSYMSSLWRLDVNDLPVESTLRYAVELLEAGSPLHTRLMKLGGRLQGLISVALSGSSLEPRVTSVDELRASLKQGSLSLSSEEPPFKLPQLDLVAPRSASEDATPFTLHLGGEGQQRAELKGVFKLGERAAEGDESPSFQLELSVSPISCQRALELIPRGALGSIEQLSATGELRPELSLSYERGRVDFKLKRLLRSCTFHELRFSRRATQARRVQVKGRNIEGRDVLWLKEPFVFEVDPALTAGLKVQVGPGLGSFVRLSELPSYVAGAMYLTEEMGFWTGGSISPSLIKNAINTNLSKGRFVYGGSTITQQLVKNLFLSRDKVLTRKLQEALIGARVIDAVGKERILELYLNCIEFGPGVFGVQEAARYYFQKSARALSPQEAVFLAMLKVSPARGARWRRRGSSPTFTWWRARSVEVFKRLVDKGLLNAKQAQGQAPFILKWDKSGQYLGAEPLEL